MALVVEVDTLMLTSWQDDIIITVDTLISWPCGEGRDGCLRVSSA